MEELKTNDNHIRKITKIDIQVILMDQLGKTTDELINEAEAKETYVFGNQATHVVSLIVEPAKKSVTICYSFRAAEELQVLEFDFKAGESHTDLSRDNYIAAQNKKIADMKEFTKAKTRPTIITDMSNPLKESKGGIIVEEGPLKKKQLTLNLK